MSPMSSIISPPYFPFIRGDPLATNSVASTGQHQRSRVPLPAPQLSAQTSYSDSTTQKCRLDSTRGFSSAQLRYLLEVRPLYSSYTLNTQLYLPPICISWRAHLHLRNSSISAPLKLCSRIESLPVCWAVASKSTGPAGLHLKSPHLAVFDCVCFRVGLESGHERPHCRSNTDAFRPFLDLALTILRLFSLVSPAWYATVLYCVSN
ncbi:hypothetical protein C8J57DRAFT_621011 [Mycena rebaudengoi]|nr:hypothetical protein C8J57DRAFT_621011 [Mycena rebaudengoi]